MAMSKGCTGGPGYKSPLEAMHEGPREKIMYVVCVHTDENKPDVLSTVDLDPSSPTYCQIIHKLRMHHVGDELHHSGWNICSSCHDKPVKRDIMVLPCLMSDRIYFVDTSNERAPVIKKVLEPEEMHKHGVSTPHTSHCSPTGEIIISTMGKPNGDALGDFICIDSRNLEIKGTWTKGEKHASFGYDFWYQPHHNVLISTEWGVPREFKTGYCPSHGKNPVRNVPEQFTDRMIPALLYVIEQCGNQTFPHAWVQKCENQAHCALELVRECAILRSLNFFSWNERNLVQSINLGHEGVAPLEVRFLHEPTASEGYVGCAVPANVHRFYKNETGQWQAEKVIDVPMKKVDGWVAPEMSGMITDILLSLDDKYLYFSNFLHGDVRQYDITDRRKPKLVGQVFLGGSIVSDSNVRIVKDEEMIGQPDPVYVKGRRLYGSPQMLQLSLDGRRLYVTNSIFKPWDKQFYPEHVKHGSTMIKLDIDVENGGMKLDENFLVDFGADKNDILLAHEMRYPGGDCTSDIWLSEKNTTV